MTFDQVDGTFYAGSERFTLTSASPRETHVEHSGSFTMRGGLVGWLLGELVVRRLFEGRVAAEMARI